TFYPRGNLGRHCRSGPNAGRGWKLPAIYRHVTDGLASLRPAVLDSIHNAWGGGGAAFRQSCVGVGLFSYSAKFRPALGGRFRIPPDADSTSCSLAARGWTRPRGRGRFASLVLARRWGTLPNLEGTGHMVDARTR